MNVVRGSFKNLTITISKVYQTKKTYSKYYNIPVNWVRPEKISCIDPVKSGDRGIDFNISPSVDLLHKFNESKELQDADEIVKRIFSLEFNPRKETVKVQKQKAIKMVQRHKQDAGSMEAMIAQLTAEILQLQEHQKMYPANRKSKGFLKELIDKRKKWLRKLRIQDYPRFEYLLEKLNLVYHPVPLEDPYITRKACTKQLLEKHCDELIKKKLNEYRKELESQQKEFFKEKAEKLEFIRNEEIACGVTPTVTEEEIEAAKQKAASFV